jgi:hypothetical protein
MKSGKVKIKIGCAQYVMDAGLEQVNFATLHIANLVTNDMVLVGKEGRYASTTLDLGALLASRDASAPQ